MTNAFIISMQQTCTYNNAKPKNFVEAAICFIPTRPTPFIVRR
jgi:hypothetical protein